MDDVEHFLNGSGEPSGILSTSCEISAPTEVTAEDLEGAIKDGANAIAVQSGSSAPYPERPSRSDKEAARRRKTFRLIKGGLDS